MKTIMIVDDDVHIGNMLEEVLTKEGYGVCRAYSGTEALLVLADHRPDLVLLDLMLPGLSGEEVLPHLTGLPVIVLSAPAAGPAPVGTAPGRRTLVWPTATSAGMATRPPGC